MTGKIFRSILTASAATLLAALVIVFGVLYSYFTLALNTQMKAQLHFAARGVACAGESYLEGLAEQNYRLTLIDTDGRVLYDSRADAATLENHGNRPEVQSAFQSGTGESARFSTALLEQTAYFAERLPDGRVLRISTARDSVLTLVLGFMQPIILTFVLAVILSAVLARRMSRRIVEPLNTLNLDEPLENEAYDEISPLLLHIEQQNRKINSQIRELQRNQTEFAAVTENMKEGLVLLSRSGTVLSINRAAAALFGVGRDCVGGSFLAVERRPDVDKAIRLAGESGHSELSLERGGRVYQLNISRIGSAEHATGTVILAFDITDKIFAERNRREFTANVSHELKTPLQSIMGSAELMESGLVKKEDMPRFTGSIRTEAARLVTLIDDIIRLSQLDEKTDMPFEPVDVYAVAVQVAGELQQAADQRHVTVRVTGSRAVISGVSRLVHELVFNLCDNAVKYNREGGRVDITVTSAENGVNLVVADTGIGIPPADQSRVFERFYRVDKSHSKETGGTGLGLSIVKHAAEYLGAHITLVSEVGQGTTVTILFSLDNHEGMC